MRKSQCDRFELFAEVPLAGSEHMVRTPMLQAGLVDGKPQVRIVGLNLRNFGDVVGPTRYKAYLRGVGAHDEYARRLAETIKAPEEPSRFSRLMPTVRSALQNLGF